MAQVLVKKLRKMFPDGTVAVEELDLTIRDGEVHACAINLGRRPTFYEHADHSLLEAHLLDFKGDLYGSRLDVAFIGFLREELKFDGLDALIRQMDDDSRLARERLAAAPDAFPKLGAI